MPLSRANPPLQGRVSGPMGRLTWPQARLILPTATRTKTYIDRVLETGPIAYFPHNELSGTVGRCLVNHAQNGTYAAALTTGEGIGDGEQAAYFDGSSQWLNIQTSALVSAFDGAECSLMGWAKVYSSSVWASTTIRQAFYLAVDGSNFIQSRHPDAVDYYQLRQTSGGTTKLYYWNDPPMPVDWFQWGISISETADQIKFYIDGAQVGTTGTNLGTWAGSPASTTIGSQGPGADKWYGWLAHTVICDEAKAASVFADLATV